MVFVVQSAIVPVCPPPPSRASVVVKCEMIWSLMKGFSSGGPVVAALPPRVQRDLICSLVRCAVGQSRQLFLSQVILLAEKNLPLWCIKINPYEKFNGKVAGIVYELYIKNFPLRSIFA